MKEQRDFFGEIDGKVDRVLKRINSRQYEGLTPSELQATGLKIGDIKKCLGVLLAEKKVKVCGERPATTRSKRLESIYKATRFATRPSPPKKKKAKTYKDIEVRQVPYLPGYRSKCPACHRDVMIIRTELGEELCDPQKRYVVFEEGFGDLAGFEEDTGKYVCGRSVTREEGLSLRHKGKCGKPWSVIRQGHFISCPAGREVWDAIWFEKEKEASINWSKITKAAQEALDCKASDI